MIRALPDLCSRHTHFACHGLFLIEAMSTSVPSFLTRLGKVKTDVSTQVLTFTTDRIGSAVVSTTAVHKSYILYCILFYSLRDIV